MADWNIMYLIYNDLLNRICVSIENDLLLPFLKSATVKLMNLQERQTKSWLMPLSKNHHCMELFFTCARCDLVSCLEFRPTSNQFVWCKYCSANKWLTAILTCSFFKPLCWCISMTEECFVNSDVHQNNIYWKKNINQLTFSVNAFLPRNFANAVVMRSEGST